MSSKKKLFTCFKRACEIAGVKRSTSLTACECDSVQIARISYIFTRNVAGRGWKICTVRRFATHVRST